MYAVLTQNWVWFSYGTVLLLLAVIVRTFTDYKMKDFMNAGRFGDFLGCGVKYLPWVTFLLYIIWLFLAVVSLILVAAFSICSNRFNSRGIAAVKNCRWYYTINSQKDKPELCGSGVSEEIAKDALWSCNSITNLKDRRFAALDCEINVSLHICGVYNSFHAETGTMTLVDAYNHLDVNSICTTQRPSQYSPVRRLENEDPDVSRNTTANQGDIPDHYWHQMNSMSDMYRYALLWALVSGFFVASVTVLTMLIRMHSPVESSFYTPADPGDFFIIKMLKNASPWNGQ